MDTKRITTALVVLALLIIGLGLSAGTAAGQSLTVDDTKTVNTSQAGELTDYDVEVTLGSSTGNTVNEVVVEYLEANQSGQVFNNVTAANLRVNNATGDEVGINNVFTPSPGRIQIDITAGTNFAADQYSQDTDGPLVEIGKVGDAIRNPVAGTYNTSVALNPTEPLTTGVDTLNINDAEINSPTQANPLNTTEDNSTSRDPSVEQPVDVDATFNVSTSSDLSEYVLLVNDTSTAGGPTQVDSQTTTNSQRTENVTLTWNHPGPNDAGVYDTIIEARDSSGNTIVSDIENESISVSEPVQVGGVADLEVSSYENNIEVTYEIEQIDLATGTTSNVLEIKQNSSNSAGTFEIEDEFTTNFLALNESDEGYRVSVEVTDDTRDGYVGVRRANVSGVGSISQVENYVARPSAINASDAQYENLADFDVSTPPGGVSVNYRIFENQTDSLADTASESISGGTFSTSSPGPQFTVPALNFSEDYKANATVIDGYNLTAEKFRPGDPGSDQSDPASIRDFSILYSFEGQNVTIDYTANLGVTAPAGGTDVTIDVTSSDPGFNDTTDSFTVPEGSDGSTVIADNTTEVGAINNSETYDITIDADGYENETVTNYSAPGSTLNVSFGTLQPKPVNITANATLGVTAPSGGKQVTFGLEAPNGTEIQNETANVPAGGDAPSVDFGPQDALGPNDSYNVTVDADGYETDGVNGTTPGAPGASENVNLGLLAAENTTISAEATLGVTAPAGGTSVEFEVENTTSGSVVNTSTVPVSQGNDTATVTFSQDALDNSDQYRITADAPEYLPDNETTPGAPGANESVSLTLDARDVTINTTAILGVTAPSGGTDVTFMISQNGTPVNSSIVTIGEGNDTGTEVFVEDALNFNEEYNVTADAPGFVTPVRKSTPGAPNATENVTFFLEPEPAVITANATLGVTAPPGGVDVDFGLEAPNGTEIQNETAALTEGDDSPSVNFSEQDALNFTENYTVTVDADGYETDGVNGTTPGAPGASENVNLGVLAAKNVTVDYDGQLEVTAPPGGVDVNVTVEVPGGNDTTDTVFVPEGQDGSTVLADNTTEAEAIDASDNYTVTLSADGYENATGTGYGPPNGTANIDAGQLDAKDVTIDYNGTLEVTAPAGGVDVNVSVDVPGGNDTTDTVFVPEGQDGSTVLADNTTEAEAIDFGENYTVTLSADGYENATGTGYGPPNGTANIDVGVLAAKNVTINATADFEVTTPQGGVAANFTLFDENDDLIDFNNETVTANESSVTTDFGERDALNFSENYTVNVTTVALGYDADPYPYAPNETTTPGAPGANETADLGTLDAADVNVTAEAELEVTAPAGGITAEYSLIDSNGTTVDTKTDIIPAGGNETSVDFDDSNALNFSENYTVTVNTTANNYDSGAYFNESLETPGKPGATENLDFGVLEAMNVTIDAEAELGVTAPAGGVNVTFTAVANETGTPDVSLTDQLAAGEDQANVTFNLTALDFEERYDVTVDTETAYNKSGYNTSGVETTPGAPGADENVDFGTLEARDVTINAKANLGVTAPEGGVSVVFGLYDETGLQLEERIDRVDEGGSMASVDFGNRSALDFEDNYVVRIEAPGYASDGLTETTPGAPEANETVEFDLEGEEVDIRAESTLDVPAPEGGVTIEYGLEDNGTVVDTVTDNVLEGDTSSGPVNFGLQDPLNFTENYTVTVDADGYLTDGVNETTPGEPGEVEEVDLGTLDAEPPAELRVTDTDIRTANPAVEGDKIVVDVTVENEGARDAVNKNVTLEVKNDTDGGMFDIVADRKVVNVSGGEEDTVTLNYTAQQGDAPEIEVRGVTEDDPVGEKDIITVLEQANILVTNVSSLNDPVVETEDLNVEATLENIGEVRGRTDVELNVETSSGDTIEAVDVVEEVFVDRGSTRNVTLTYTTQLGDADNTTTDDLTVQAVTEDDPAGENDTAQVEAAEKDLVVTRVNPDDPVTEGEDLKVDVSVENRGDIDAVDENVTLTVDNDTDGVFETDADSEEVNVSTGTERTVTLTYTTQAGDADEVGVKAEIDGSERTDTADVRTPPAFNVFRTEPRDPVVEGETLEVDIAVQNNGGTAGETDYVLEVEGQGEVDRIENVTIAGNSQVSRTLNYTTQDGDAPSINVTGRETADNTSDTAEAEVLEQAEFVVSNLDPEDGEVAQGDNLTITADITNVGDVEGDANATLTVRNDTTDNVVLQQDAGDVTVAGGATEEVSIEIVNLSLGPGEYTHEISTQDDNETGNLTVNPDMLFGVPLIDDPDFNAPPTNTGELNQTLFEDLNGDGDGLDVNQTVKVFRELALGNELQGTAQDGTLTDEEARALNWNEDSPETEVTVSDMVSLFGEQIRAD